MSRSHSMRKKTKTAQPCGLQPDSELVIEASIALAARVTGNKQHERGNVNDAGGISHQDASEIRLAVEEAEYEKLLAAASRDCDSLQALGAFLLSQMDNPIMQRVTLSAVRQFLYAMSEGREVFVPPVIENVLKQKFRKKV